MLGSAPLGSIVRRTKSLVTKAEKQPAAPLSEADAEQKTGELADLVLATLDDDKAQDVVALDLKDKSSVTDVMIVASGRSQRHVSALSDHVIKALKEAGYRGARVEGMPACDWVLIDAGDVVVHLFRPEVREFYNLEKLWSVTTQAEATE